MSCATSQQRTLSIRKQPAAAAVDYTFMRQMSAFRSRPVRPRSRATSHWRPDTFSGAIWLSVSVPAVTFQTRTSDTDSLASEFSAASGTAILLQRHGSGARPGARSEPPSQCEHWPAFAVSDRCSTQQPQHSGGPAAEISTEQTNSRRNTTNPFSGQQLILFEFCDRGAIVIPK
jgi:hypothetical protein